MQFTADYWEQNAEKALQLARTIQLLEGADSSLARALERRYQKWNQRAMQARAMPGGYRGSLS